MLSRNKQANFHSIKTSLSQPLTSDDKCYFAKIDHKYMYLTNKRIENFSKNNCMHTCKGPSGDTDADIHTHAQTHMKTHTHTHRNTHLCHWTSIMWQRLESRPGQRGQTPWPVVDCRQQTRLFRCRQSWKPWPAIPRTLWHLQHGRRVWQQLYEQEIKPLFPQYVEEGSAQKIRLNHKSINYCSTNSSIWIAKKEC